MYFNKNWLFENFKETASLFALETLQQDRSGAIYPYWIDNWSKKRHEQILDNLGKFIESGEYRMNS